MKILYIEAKHKETIAEDHNIAKNFIDKLPKEIFLAYSIQFENLAKAVKKVLEANSIQIKGFQQVLGCTKLKTNYPILLIGQGKFHALNLALQNKQPIILYNNGNSILIGERDIEELKKKQTSGFSKFLSADKIGILVSTKPGQENIKQAIAFKKKIIKKYSDKKIYILIFNTINLNEFENFDIDFFINTACPGLLNDSNKIANIDDILPFFN